MILAVFDLDGTLITGSVLQGIVDRCTEQNRTGNESGDVWLIKFKTKKGAARGIGFPTDQSAEAKAWMASDDYTTAYEMNPGRGTRGLCINREIKELEFSEDKVVVQRTLRPNLAE